MLIDKDIDDVIVKIHTKYFNNYTGINVSIQLLALVEMMGLHHHICILHVIDFYERQREAALGSMSVGMFYVWLKQVAYYMNKSSYLDTITLSDSNSLTIDNNLIVFVKTYLMPIADIHLREELLNYPLYKKFMSIVDMSCIKVMKCYARFFQLWFISLLIPDVSNFIYFKESILCLLF